MKNLLLLFIALLPFELLAQQIRSSNQQFVEEAVKEGMVVISQSYQLKDSISGMVYGRNGREEFGKAYALGIKTKDGFITSSDIVRPWERDANYARYRDSHIPVLYKTAYKELADSSMTAWHHEKEFNTQSLWRDSLLMYNDTTVFQGEGFDIHVSLEDIDGWLVWVANERTIQEADSAFDVSYIIHRHTVAYSDSIREWNLNAPQILEKRFWGGIFLKPVKLGIGKISFELCGVLHQNLSGEWKLVMPFFSPRPREDESEEAIGLTPVSALGEEEVIGDKDGEGYKESNKKEKQRKKSKSDE